MELDLSSSYNNPAYSDWTIASSEDGREFQVHKFIVARASPFFKALLAERQGNSMIAVRENGLVLNRILGFMYGRKFVLLPPTTTESVDSDLKIFVQTIEAADKAIKALPQLPREARLGIATALCGDNLCGSVIKTLLQSITGDEVPQNPSVRGTPATAAETKQAQKRTPKPSAKVKDNGPFALQEQSKKKHCLCGTHALDQTLLQCDGCDEWCHPGCIGKGQYPAKTYEKSKDWAQKRDVGFFKNKNFRCLECEPNAQW